MRGKQGLILLKESIWSALDSFVHSDQEFSPRIYGESCNIGEPLDPMNPQEPTATVTYHNLHAMINVVTALVAKESIRNAINRDLVYTAPIGVPAMSMWADNHARRTMVVTSSV